MHYGMHCRRSLGRISQSEDKCDGMYIVEIMQTKMRRVAGKEDGNLMIHSREETTCWRRLVLNRNRFW